MNAREIVTKRLNHEGTETTPYTVSFEPELYRRLTEHYGDPDWESKKLRKFICQYLGVDNQLLTEIEAPFLQDVYGAIWRFDKKPWHLVKPALDKPSLAGYNFPGPEVFTKDLYKNKPEAIKQYEANAEQYRVIGMGWGIFEHTWRIRGFENTLIDMVEEEGFYQELTERIADNYVAMVKACEDVPADAYHFGDDWGDQRGVIFGPERWRKFLKPCWARIYAEVHKQGKKVLQHSCGSIAEIYDDCIEIGMDCHESVQPEALGMAPEVIKAKWGQRISFWGCLGSQSVLTSGTPSEIRDEIFRLHRLFKDDGGFMLAPAKPLVDEMKIEQAVAVIETLGELS
jgi:uroporphyrinogen decarboxylase